ncbi:asparagine synthetase B family protein [Parabacteroides sp. AM08-6]|uniref:asparagine synthase-related protein n=1 Tax=Parabacteroides sp. AM08-6 TaxID=2292053 RepID=UPI000EFF36AD|nr:asparagine synthetase B family protein [Parabacteroides sp. AM08-6]RHJ87756.1 asparagine synthetase B family protein [Parabacteroides sp. AM08-6]
MFIGRWNKGDELPEMAGMNRKDGLIYSGSCSFFEQNEVKIWFFGELYNKRTLCCFLENNAEAFWDVYNRKGLEGIACLDGAFTCILKKPDTILLVRDHHGLSEQVYYNDTYFASSLSLLRMTQGFDTTPDYQSLATFLSVGYIGVPHSAFKTVRKLGGGETIQAKNGRLECHSLYNTTLIEPATSNKTLDECADEYAALHAEAIKKRIGQSSNVGILLSGGYDSGCNLAALRSFYKGDIHSFSIGFKGDNWTELPLARCMSDTFHTKHTEYEIDGSEIDALPDIIQYLGDPFVEGGLMVNYSVMKLVSANRPDVLLGGDGNDQYFGTSGREVALHYLISRYGIKPFAKLLYGLLNRSMFDKDTEFYRIRFHLDKILHILDGDLFGFSSFQLKQLLKEPVQNRASSISADIRSFEHLYTQHQYKGDIEKIINQVILFKASKLADMFGNHLTFPYMDLDLYNFIMKLPVSYKCKGESVSSIAKGQGASKFLLKYHYKSMLPEVITSKKKQGGFAPMPIFFKDDDQRNRIADYILSSSVVSDFLNKKAVEHFINRYDKEEREGGNWFWYRQNRAIQYFNLLALAVWWDEFVKQKSVSLI